MYEAAFRTHGNFELFAFSLRHYVLVERAMVKEAERAYANSTHEHYEYDGVLMDKVQNAQTRLSRVQEIESTFVSLLSPEAKSALPQIWEQAKSSFEKNNIFR